MWPAYCLARLGGGVGKFCWLAAMGGRGGVALWWGRERLGKLPPPPRSEAWQLWWTGSRGEFRASEAAQLEAVALSLEPREGGGRTSCILLRHSINSFMC